MKVIYLDNNATTKVAPEVVDAMLPYLPDYYGNPSSMHSFGGDVAEKIKEARENVASLIGATADEIVFTSCGTESDSTAIRAAVESNPDRKHILTSRVEHPAVKNLYEVLSKKGYQVTFVPVDNDGILDLDYLYNSLDDDTAIVSLMWANNETGVIFPVEEISREVKDRGIIFHTDAVQAVGKLGVSVGDLDVDVESPLVEHGPQLADLRLHRGQVPLPAEPGVDAHDHDKGDILKYPLDGFHRCGRVQGHCRFRSFFANQLNGAVQMGTCLLVHGDIVSAGFGKIGDIAFR